MSKPCTSVNAFSFRNSIGYVWPYAWPYLLAACALSSAMHLAIFVWVLETSEAEIQYYPEFTYYYMPDEHVRVVVEK